jgi:hypothetical protein
MAANASGAHQKIVEEVCFQNEAVSLCLMINRRAQLMRVIDFRSGATDAKRSFLLSFARREHVVKVFTLVERDEAASWVKLGFAKEASIPSFYKRSDAFILGCLVADENERTVASGDRAHLPNGREPPLQSETRLAVAQPLASSSAGMTEAHARMERTIVAGKKGLKDLTSKALPTAKLALVPEAHARRAASLALRRGHALTAFEPFGRDVDRRYFCASVRGGFELYASIESQVCFGNAYLELLQGPRTEAEKLATTAALKASCDRLLSEGLVSCFSLAPSDDIPLATVFLSNGFRRTGLLPLHLAVGRERRDAILWSRKLANPGDE